MSLIAVGTELISRIVGYVITKGDFSESSPNLPQRIALLGEANVANQSGLDTDAIVITTARRAGELFGFGSPIHMAMRILRPANGGGVGGVPIVVYPQEEAVGATTKTLTITPTGVATGSGTHTVKIAGRRGLEGQFYNVNIATGDTTDDITEKITDAINAVLGSPVTANDTTYEVEVETKWAGLTANAVNVSVDTNGNDLGITYSVVATQAGSGTPDIAGALAQFGNDWNTIVVNTYGTQSDILNALEDFNGIPDPLAPTGRYAGIIMKPFIALTGSTAEDPSSITDARKSDVTIAICPAPLSDGCHWEAAANMCVLYARQAQDTPHLDVSGRDYPDMPVPVAIGDMANYDNRDAIVKKGCSTVDLVAGNYRVMDFVTTYHPDGETPPQFRYVRNLNIDFNVRYGYYLLEQINVVDHVIADDNDVVTASRVIKPKIWKQIVDRYAVNLSERALIVQPAFTQDSIAVNISTINPDRLETFFRYKRSGYARIASTTAEAGFNFGTLN
jgi:phage tail sheath gpL-like